MKTYKIINAKKYNKSKNESKRLIETLQEQLDLQAAIDTYKDDLVLTLQRLLSYKEDAIDHLKGKLRELKNP